MRQTSRWLAAAGAVAILAACSDGPMEPISPGESALSLSGHLSQAGQSNTWHGYYAPVLEVEDGPQLCATWTDFGSLEGKLEDLYGEGAELPSGEPPNHYSYDFELWEEGEGDGEWIKVETVNGDPEEGMTACLDLSEWDDGTYKLRVKGIAHVGSGPDRSNHHTDYAYEEVTVGSTGFSFFIAHGNANTVEAGEIVATPGGNAWHLDIQLHYGGVALDCTTDLPAELEAMTLTWETSPFTEAETWSRDLPNGQNDLKCQDSGWFRISVNQTGQPSWPDSGTLSLEVVYDGVTLSAGEYTYDLSQ